MNSIFRPGLLPLILSISVLASDDAALPIPKVNVQDYAVLKPTLSQQEHSQILLRAQAGELTALDLKFLTTFLGYGVPAQFGAARRECLESFERGGPVATVFCALGRGSYLRFGCSIREKARTRIVQVQSIFEKGAERQDSFCMLCNSLCYRALNRDAEADKWLVQSAESGCAYAQVLMESEMRLQMRWTEAFEWANKAAKPGDSFGEALLGLEYLIGKGVKQDRVKCDALFRSSAEKGNALGQYFLFLTHRDRDGLPWLERAANQDDEDAQYELALLYFNGEIVAHNPDKAMSLMKQSAENGNGKAAIWLSRRFSSGNVKDLEQALHWAEKAMDEDPKAASESAGFLLYLSLESTSGSASDQESALDNLRREASNENPEALYYLAEAYDQGTGVQRELETALQLYEKAAALGNADAAFEIGKHFELGNGCERNIATAIQWYRKASAQGNVDASKRAESLRK